MREKDRGIWQSYTWRECYAHVRDSRWGWRRRLQARRQALRARRQPRRASTGRSWRRRRSAACPCRSIRTRLPASSPTCSSTPRCPSIVAEDQEQVDKVLSIAGELPSLAARRLRGPARHERLRASASSSPSPNWRTMGGAFGKENPGYFERELDARQRAEDVGADRLHLRHHRAIEGRAAEPRQHDRHVGELRQRRRAEARRQLAVLPADGMGRRLDLSPSAPAWWSAPTCNCPESPETVQRDLRELGPTALCWRRRASGRAC